VSLPLFFHNADLHDCTTLQLEEETARHVIQVLRMQEGDELLLTNGKGLSANAFITKAEKKKLSVRLKGITYHQQPATKLHLYIAFTKNASRNEWLLEKATELGVSTITPLITTRTERERIRYDRWSNILIAALIQSRQYHLPVLNQATPFNEILQGFNAIEQKLVGHCIGSEERKPVAEAMHKAKETVVLIGPEGDFTPEEVKSCFRSGFRGISLVNQRLRTETAAVAVCAYFNLINHED